MNKILVVDDEPEIVKVFSARLKSNGYEAISAADGNEGIKKTQQQNPDLIIMDIMMPDMSGSDAVRILQADAGTEHIPIIFLTGVMENLPEGKEKREADIGGKLFMLIAKPFKLETLLLEIKSLIGDK